MLDKLAKRRSIRTYTGEAVPENKLETILKAGLMSPTSKNLRPWRFLVVQDKDMLNKLSDARDGSADMLKNADAAIIVMADTEVNDVWIEDCSIAMSNMHITAADEGIGSCWIQIRNRTSREGFISSADYIRDLFGIDCKYAIEAILSLGIAAKERPPVKITEDLWEKVYYSKFE